MNFGPNHGLVLKSSGSNLGSEPNIAITNWVASRLGYTIHCVKPSKTGARTKEGHWYVELRPEAWSVLGRSTFASESLTFKCSTHNYVCNSVVSVTLYPLSTSIAAKQLVVLKKAIE